MVSASNTFGFSLLRAVNATFADSNVFLSPLSASMALGMTMNGAVGATFNEMRSTLGFGTQTYDELNRSYQSLIALLRGLDRHVDFRRTAGLHHRAVTHRVRLLCFVLCDRIRAARSENERDCKPSE